MRETISHHKSRLVCLNGWLLWNGSRTRIDIIFRGDFPSTRKCALNLWLDGMHNWMVTITTTARANTWMGFMVLLLLFCRYWGCFVMDSQVIIEFDAIPNALLQQSTFNRRFFMVKNWIFVAIVKSMFGLYINSVSPMQQPFHTPQTQTNQTRPSLCRTERLRTHSIWPFK